MVTANTGKSLIKVRYFIMGDELSSREYTYYSEEALQIGDIITVPVRDTTAKAKVTAIDVPETEVAAFRDKVKAILTPQAEIPIAVKEIETVEPNAHNIPQTTSLTTVNPKDDMLFIDLGNKAITLSQYAQTRVITSTDDLKACADDLNLINQLTKLAKDSLRIYIKPFTDYVDEVKADFKLVLDPLEEAYKLNRAKSTAFLQEQKVKQLEAEELNRQQEELTLRMAAAKGMVATESGVINPATGEVVVPTKKMDIPPTTKKVYSATGSIAMTDNWQWEPEDLTQVPRQYLMLDRALITRAVKQEKVRNIPGIRIFNAGGIRVTQRGV